jgi:putative intracellular protease/amidase
MADTYRLLLDENIEHEVLDRLVDAGHDVEHVDTVANLGKGAKDTELAGYSVATDRAIVTYDDDFIADVPPTDYRAVFSPGEWFDTARSTRRCRPPRRKRPAR